jgi:hypothetical protein
MSPFLKVVPEDMREDLLDDFLIEWKKISPLKIEQGEPKFVQDPEGLLVWGVKNI